MLTGLARYSTKRWLPCRLLEKNHEPFVSPPYGAGDAISLFGRLALQWTFNDG